MFALRKKLLKVLPKYICNINCISFSHKVLEQSYCVCLGTVNLYLYNSWIIIQHYHELFRCNTAWVSIKGSVFNYWGSISKRTFAVKTYCLSEVQRKYALLKKNYLNFIIFVRVWNFLLPVASCIIMNNPVYFNNEVDVLKSHDLYTETYLQVMS